MFTKQGLLAAVMCGVLSLAPIAMADTIELTGVIRDFKRGDVEGGHPDFQTAGAMNRFGHVTGMVTMELGGDGKPVYNPVRPTKDTMYSEASFNQWFRDVPGVNMSKPFTISLDNNQDGPGGIYSFSSNAFYPINNQLFGNEGFSHNYHFTYEINTQFLYRPGQKFTFIGDDDVWVYINGVRVIDIGGVHSAITGAVLLFDGKAFVEKNHFSTGGLVQSVSSNMKDVLHDKWQKLGLPGTCPINTGDRYVELNLNAGEADILCSFNDSSVTVSASNNLSNVVIVYTDGTSHTFDNLNVGSSHTFTSPTGHAIRGAYVRTGANQDDQAPYFAADGGGASCTLDFFFAERHTTQSNFRIDTSINLETVPPTTISPLYD